MSDWDRPPEREKEGGRVVLLMLLGLLVLLGGGYAAAHFATADKVPRGTTIAGVPVGGRSRADAVRALRAGLAGRADGPLVLDVAGRGTAVTPARAGLRVDYDASVAAAGAEHGWDPSRLWDYYTGGEDLDAVVTVDQGAMTSLLQRLSSSLGRPARDGAVAFDGDQIRTTPPRTGLALDLDQARAALEASYLHQRRTPRLSLGPTEPEIDAADVQRALTDFANPAVSGSVTLVFGSSRVRLQPREFGTALAMKAENGALVPDVDEQVLTRLVDGAVSGSAPVDATVALVQGRPRVVPARPGVSYDPAVVGRVLLRAVTRPEGKRQLPVTAIVVEPGFTTADARKLRVKERVSTFTTYFPHADYRNTNIVRAAELVDGTVLKPGQTFSLNRTVGERTPANGFTTGLVINGSFEEDLDGGVSQVATTTFNAMFFAGLQDVEHQPHSFYIDRYPAGREAAVAWGSADLRFRDDTPYGVLISAHVTPSTPGSSGVVTVSMWSTKYWDITTSTSDRSHPTPPRTRVLRTPDCVPNTGSAGFDVDVTRYFHRPGQSAVDHSEVRHTHYLPADTVVCRK